MASPAPVLIVSDAPSSPTGLGRITREIAIRAADSLKDACRIATLGTGGPGSRKFNFEQYAMEGLRDNFVIPNLPETWEDWAGNERGVILVIWDASRMGWFSRPNNPDFDDLPAPLRLFLTAAKFERWTYTPLDAEGPNGKLAYPQAQSLLGFDRILAYGAWAEKVIRRSLGDEAAEGRDLSSIPHGIDAAVFFERERPRCRMNFYSLTGANALTERQIKTAILEDEPLVGTIATNQSRKDWGLWAETAALFLKRHPKARFWVHTDALERYWSIPQLIIDFGLLDRTVISLGHLDDERMAKAYSACDITLGIGSGEGFGLPIAESLFCGTPCVHGNYAGAVDFMSKSLLVNPIAYRYEGLYCCKRPIFGAIDWTEKMESLLGNRVSRPDEIDWSNVWPKFEAWFRKGLKGFQ